MERISLLLVFVLTPAVAAVPTGGEFSLPRTTLEGGGGRVSAAGFVLDGSIGQAETQRLSGGGFTLDGGFWRRGETASGQIFADGFE